MPLLEVKNLSKAFGGVRAVDGVDFSVEAGELRCIIGPNGAGKSTIFKLLLGSIRPDRGTIQFKGRDITRMQPHRRTHMGIGVKFQNLGVYQALTVRHNLQLPLQHQLSGAAMDAEIVHLLDRLNLRDMEDETVGSLSHGQKQWLAIGMVLALKPSLLLLDEPTAGMSPEETRATGELVEAVNREGVTALVVEHDMAFVRQLAAPHYGSPLRPRVRRRLLGRNRESRRGAANLSGRATARRRTQTELTPAPDTGNTGRDTAMQKIKRGDVPSRYAFDWEDEPVLRVAQGEAFQLETDDALSGLIADDSDDPLVHEFTSEHVEALKKVWPPTYNPVVGPIYVEGCERATRSRSTSTGSTPGATASPASCRASVRSVIRNGGRTVRCRTSR